MYITSRSLRTIAYSTLAFSVAHASYAIDNLSFGHKEGQYLSPDLRDVPHWTVQGIDDFKPQVLSDRVILTPPYPGSKRGSLWSNDPLHHHGEWTAEMTFRANGMERGGGNLQLWYVKDSQARDVPNSLYTASKFDGLVLVIDQYEGRGGSVRGFLNDGSVDFKGQPNLDTMAFGKCDYAYRNRGSMSTIKLHHLEEFIEVLVDDQPCFKTNKVKLPDGYHFGISAASAENPDSFEVFKFALRTTNSNTREEPRGSGRFPPKDQQQQQQQQKEPEPPKKMGSSMTIQDVLANTIKSQDDQFADLHNRIQDMSHHVNTVYEHLEYLESFQAKRHNEIMAKLASLEDRTAHTVRTLENTERVVNAILRDVESKDFKDLLNQVHRAIDTSHQGLSADMPAAMKQIVGSHGPSWVMFLCIAVAVQIMVTGAYIIYKKRRNGAPKKYL